MAEHQQLGSVAPGDPTIDSASPLMVQRIQQVAVLLDAEREPVAAGPDAKQGFRSRLNYRKIAHIFAKLMAAAVVVLLAVVTLVAYLLQRSDFSDVPDYRLGPRYYDHPVSDVTHVPSAGKAVLCTRGGGVQVLTLGNSFWRQYTRLSTQGRLLRDDVLSAGVDGRSNLYFLCADGNNNGLCRATDDLGQWQVLLGLDRFAEMSVPRPPQLTAARQFNQTIWIATDGAGVGEYDRTSHTWTNVYNADNSGLGSNHVYDIATSDKGDAYLATAAGVSRLRQEHWASFDKSSGLVGADARRVLWSGDRLWYLTAGMGVGQLFDNGDAKAVISETCWGSTDDAVELTAAVSDSNQSRLCLASRTGSVGRYDAAARSWASYLPIPSMPRINQLYAADANGSEVVRAATANGAWEAGGPGENWRLLGLGGMDVRGLYGNAGGLSAGACGEPNGPFDVYLNDGAQWGQIQGRGKAALSQGAMVAAAMEPNSFLIYAADSNQVCIYSLASRQWLDPMPVNTGQPGGITDLAWQGGRLWCLQASSRLTPIVITDGNTAQPIGGGDALAPAISSITAMERDPNGRCWFNTDKGLSIYDPDAHRWQAVKGVGKIDQLAMTSQCAWALSDGRLLCMDTNGIATFAPTIPQAGPLQRIRGGLQSQSLLLLDQQGQVFVLASRAAGPQMLVGAPAKDLDAAKVSQVCLVPEALLASEPNGLLYSYDLGRHHWTQWPQVRCAQMISAGPLAVIREPQGKLHVFSDHPVGVDAVKAARQIIGAKGKFCLALAEDGAIWKFSDAAWHRVQAPWAEGPAAGECLSSRWLAQDDCLLVGTPKALWRLDWASQSWKRQIEAVGQTTPVAGVKELKSAGAQAFCLADSGKLYRQRDRTQEQWEFVCKDVQKLQAASGAAGAVTVGGGVAIVGESGPATTVLPDSGPKELAKPLLDAAVCDDKLYLLTEGGCAVGSPDLSSWAIVPQVGTPRRLLSPMGSRPWMLAEKDAKLNLYRLAGEGANLQWEQATAEPITAAAACGPQGRWRIAAMTAGGGAAVFAPDGGAAQLVAAPTAMPKVDPNIVSVSYFHELYHVLFADGSLCTYDPIKRDWKATGAPRTVQVLVVPVGNDSALWIRSAEEELLRSGDNGKFIAEAKGVTWAEPAGSDVAALTEDHRLILCRAGRSRTVLGPMRPPQEILPTAAAVLASATGSLLMLSDGKATQVYDPQSRRWSTVSIGASQMAGGGSATAILAADGTCQLATVEQDEVKLSPVVGAAKLRRLGADEDPRRLMAGLDDAGCVTLWQDGRAAPVIGAAANSSATDEITAVWPQGQSLLVAQANKEIQAYDPAARAWRKGDAVGPKDVRRVAFGERALFAQTGNGELYSCRDGTWQLLAQKVDRWMSFGDMSVALVVGPSGIALWQSSGPGGKGAWPEPPATRQGTPPQAVVPLGASAVAILADQQVLRFDPDSKSWQAAHPQPSSAPADEPASMPAGVPANVATTSPSSPASQPAGAIAWVGGEDLLAYVLGDRLYVHTASRWDKEGADLGPSLDSPPRLLASGGNVLLVAGGRLKAWTPAAGLKELPDFGSDIGEACWIGGKLVASDPNGNTLVLAGDTWKPSADIPRVRSARAVQQRAAAVKEAAGPFFELIGKTPDLPRPLAAAPWERFKQQLSSPMTAESMLFEDILFRCLARGPGLDVQPFNTFRSSLASLVAELSRPGLVQWAGTPGWLGYKWQVGFAPGGFALATIDSRPAYRMEFSTAAGRFQQDQVTDLALCGKTLWLMTPAGLVPLAGGAAMSLPLPRIGDFDIATPGKMIRAGGKTFAMDAKGNGIALDADGNALPLDATAAKGLQGLLYQDSEWRICAAKQVCSIEHLIGGAWVDRGFSSKEGLAADRLAGFAADSDGRLIALTGGGLVLYDAARNQWDRMPVAAPKDGSFATADRLLRTADGGLWVRFGQDNRWSQLQAREPMQLSAPVALDANVQISPGAVCRQGPMEWLCPSNKPASITRLAADGKRIPVHFTERRLLDADVIQDVIATDEGLWLSTQAGLQRVDPRTMQVLTAESSPLFLGRVQFMSRQGRLLAAVASNKVFAWDSNTWSEVSAPLSESPLQIGPLRIRRGTGGVEMAMQTESNEVPTRLTDQGRFDFQQALDLGIAGQEVAILSPTGLWTRKIAAASAPSAIWPLTPEQVRGGKLTTSEDGLTCRFDSGALALEYRQGRWTAAKAPVAVPQTESKRWRVSGQGEATKVEVSFDRQEFSPLPDLCRTSEVPFWRPTQILAADGGDWWTLHAIGVSHFSAGGELDAIHPASRFGGAAPERLEMSDDAPAAVTPAAWYVFRGNAWEKSAQAARQAIGQDISLLKADSWKWTRLSDGNVRISRSTATGELPLDWTAGRFSDDVVCDGVCVASPVLVTRAGVVGREGPAGTSLMMPVPQSGNLTSVRVDRLSGKLVATDSNADAHVLPVGDAATHLPDENQIIARSRRLFDDGVWRLDGGSLSWNDSSLRVQDGRFAHDQWRAVLPWHGSLWLATAGGVAQVSAAGARPAMIALSLCDRMDLADLAVDNNDCLRAIGAGGAHVRDANGSWSSSSDAPAARTLLRISRWHWRRSSGHVEIAADIDPVDVAPAPNERLVQGRFAEDAVYSVAMDDGYLWEGTADGVLRQRVSGGQRTWYRSGLLGKEQSLLGAVVKIWATQAASRSGKALWALDAAGRTWRYSGGDGGSWQSVEPAVVATLDQSLLAAVPMVEARKDPSGKVVLNYRNVQGAQPPILSQGRFTIDQARSMTIHKDRCFLATPAGVVRLDANGDYQGLLANPCGDRQGASPMELLAHKDGRLYVVDDRQGVWQLADDANSTSPFASDDAWRQEAELLVDDSFWRWGRRGGRVWAKLHNAAFDPNWPLLVDGRFSFDVIRDLHVRNDTMWMTTAGGIARYAVPSMELQWLEVQGRKDGDLVALYDAGRFLPGSSIRVTAGDAMYVLNGQTWELRSGKQDQESQMSLADGGGVWHIRPGAKQGIHIDYLDDLGHPLRSMKEVSAVPYESLMGVFCDEQGLWLCAGNRLWRLRR